MRAACGLDVHKDSVFLCIVSETGEIIEKVFGVLTYQLEDMRRLMQSCGVVEVTMESTSVYWIPIWRVLEPHFRLKLVNPYFIRQLPGRKSDVKDAQWIPECTLKDLVRDLCDGVTDPEALITRIHGRITGKHGRETILAALTGEVSQAETDAMRQLKEELDLARKLTDNMGGDEDQSIA